MKKYLLGKGWAPILPFIMLFSCYPSHARNASPLSITLFQQQTVSGTIADATSPLPGATILIKGTTTATISDGDGKFSLAASNGDILIIEFMGYDTVELVVAAPELGTIQLTASATTLDEVTINAGYYTVSRKEATGSIAKLNSSDIEKQPITNPLAALQGRMAGVIVTQASGVPGGGFAIQVRGRNSIRPGASQPLYIIDGVPFSAQSLSENGPAYSILAGTPDPLSGINPADIQSIEVLKDADATAIYGSRGANGVVLITTKKGAPGKMKVELRSYTGIGQITRRLPLLSTLQYLTMREQAFANDGITVLPPYAYDLNGTWDRNHYTDWQEELIGGQSTTQQTQLSFSGGSEHTQYLVSGTSRRETTVFPGNGAYGKSGVHTSIRHASPDQRFTLQLNTGYFRERNTQPRADLTSQAYSLAPNAPALYDSNGNLNWEGGTFENPLAFLEGDFRSEASTLTAGANLQYKLPGGFTVSANLGYTEHRLDERQATPSTSLNPSYGLGSEYATLYLTQGTRSSWIAEPQVGYGIALGELKVDLLAGTTFQKQVQRQLATYGMGFASNSLINSLAAASNIYSFGDQEVSYAYQAVYSRANLNWKGTYILNLTARRDGSSRFGPGNRFATFGAVGGAWVFSREAFLEGLPLSFGKLRASYGTTGSDNIGDYQFLNTYSISGNNYNGIIGLAPTRLYNPDFSWETNRKLEIALELGAFKDRVFLTASWFRNRSSSQLVGIPLPATTGFTTLQANLDATVENTGLEFSLESHNLSGALWSWHTGANITFPRNKLVAFDNIEGSTYSGTLAVGKPLSIAMAYDYQGIDPQTGVYKFRDVDGDGQLTIAGDRVMPVDISQRWFAGLSNEIKYKNWSFDFLFQAVRQDGRNYRSYGQQPGAMFNQPVYALDGFPTGNSSQVLTTGANNEAVTAYALMRDSNAAISDASYIRLKSANLSYTLQGAWLNGATARLYIQGQNLLTITHYKGADPETLASQFLPPLRQWVLGVEIGL